MIVLGTGKGKSHVIMQLVERLQMRTLILTHNIKTLHEMEQKFKTFVYDELTGTKCQP